MIIVAIGLLMIIICLLIKTYKNIYYTDKNEKQPFNSYKYKYSYSNPNTPYKKRYFLTKNELNFYKKLKPMSDKYNLCVMAKIRLADLVEVDSYKTKEFNKYFSKIKAKHIDFALSNPENLEIKYLIELDDSSHNKQDRIERDLFVNKICKETGYVLIRTHGDIMDIEKIINNKYKSNTKYFA